MIIIHKKVQELANGIASARDLNRDLSRFSNPPPIGDRLGGEKFKDRDAGAASCQLLNHFVYRLCCELKPLGFHICYFRPFSAFAAQSKLLPKVNTDFT